MEQSKNHCSEGTIPSLCDIYYEMWFQSHWHFVDWRFTDVPIWLEMKYGVTRWQARKIRDIMWGWARTGYVPSRHIKALHRGRYPLRKRR